LLVVRRGTARAITVAPVFVISATIAALVIPRDHQQTLHGLRFIAAPLEVLAIILIVRRIAAMRQRPDARGDPLTRLEAAVREIFGESRAAKFIASEVAVAWYAMFGWKRAPDVPSGARSFTIHERGGWSSVVVGFIILIVAESIGVHLLVRLWSLTTAW